MPCIFSHRTLAIFRYQEIIMSKKIKEIPYGVSDYGKIRAKNKYFVDKTRFIHLLEKHEYVFFIRPRRFGKSLWLSVLECYYDINLKDRFDFFFKGTQIGQNSTPEKNSYFILRLDFSAINPDIKKVEHSFENYCSRVIKYFLLEYEYAFDKNLLKEMDKCSSVVEKIDAVFMYAKNNRLKIYMLIDEYDNFANTILSTAGKEAYHKLTHGEGFFRHFFSKLKSATAMRESGLERLFITGVSPITLDDVTSGFNIGTNISLLPVFNEMAGFTEEEVLEMLNYYKDVGQFMPAIEESMKIMHKWYNGYKFSDQALSSVFNTDMTLYFVNISIVNRLIPRYLIDDNIKIDYGKLRHLIFVNRRLNGNFDILKTIMEQGEIISPVNQSFPIEQLIAPDNFISLLYFFGLLTFREMKEGDSLLVIPNLAISHLMYGYIRGAYKDADIFRINLWKFGNLVRKMAWEGEWEAVFSFLAEEVRAQTSIRDYLQGEKIIQGFLLAYMSINDFLIPHTEYEADKGYSDFFLEPFLLKYPEIPYGYLIEIKYIKRGDLTDSLLKKVQDEAKKQLDQYAADKCFSEKYKNQKILKIILVYHGWEMVLAKSEQELTA
jgi:hypothetical protein